MSSVRYPASPGQNAELLIGEARERQRRRRWRVAALILCLVIAVSVFVVAGRGFGAGGNPAPRRAARALGSSASSLALRPAGSIRWLFRHQARGESLGQAGISLGALVGSHWQPVRFARVLRPDPTGKYLIALSLIGKRGLNVCITTLVGRKPLGGGCGAGLDLRPFNSTLFSGSNLRTALLAGVAADSVARIVVRTPSGHQLPVALHDNTFVVRVPKSKFPLQLIAYNSHSQRIGTTRWASASPAPTR